MKKILISLSIIAAVAVIAIGATTAYFSDTETSSGNTLTTGTLDLYVNGENPLEGPIITLKDMKPSDKRESEPIILHVADNPGHLYKHIKEVKCEQGTQTEPEELEEGDTPKSDLPNYTWFDLKVNENIFIPDEKVKLNDLISKWIYLGKYYPEKDAQVIQSFHLDKSVTNWAQGDVCTFSEEFMVLQANAPHPENCYNCPVADWRFSESSGNTAYDSSVNGNNGTINGATWSEGGLSFDGVDDYVEVPHSSSLNISGSEITLEAWIKTNTLPSAAGERWQILGKADAYALQIADGGGGKARVWLGPLTTYVQTDSPEISTGLWYHLVGVYDSSSVKIYINGVLKKEVSKTGNQATSSNNLIIGARIPGGYFNGIIDEARVYNRALSTGEILEHYNTGR